MLAQTNQCVNIFLFFSFLSILACFQKLFAYFSVNFNEKYIGKTINILFDNKTTKIASKNSLREYIIAYIVYEEGLDVTINFEYKDSDAGDAFIVQAADYVANAIYSKYEYNNNVYSNLLNSKINIVQHFPYKNFGK